MGLQTHNVCNTALISLVIAGNEPDEYLTRMIGLVMRILYV